MVSEDLTLLNMERVTALVSNYKEKGFVYQLATYLREWQQEGAWDSNDFGYQHLCFHVHLRFLLGHDFLRHCKVSRILSPQLRSAPLKSLTAIC